MTEKSVPVVGLRNRIPRPIGSLRVHKNDAHALIRSSVSLQTYQSRFGIFARASSFLKPRVLIRGVIQNQFGDHPHAALVRRRQESLEILECSITRMHRSVVGDVVAVVAQR